MGPALEDAILRAAAEVPKESGVPGLTMDEVARRAGTNKNAIYRRWPSRVALGIAAYSQLAAADITPPDTGSLRGDALGMLRRANSTWSSPYEEILRGLFAAAGGAPQLLAGLRGPAAGGTAYESAWLTLLGQAVARGGAAPEPLHPRVAAAPTAVSAAVGGRAQVCFCRASRRVGVVSAACLVPGVAAVDERQEDLVDDLGQDVVGYGRDAAGHVLVA